jgi:hypothetical protein
MQSYCSHFGFSNAYNKSLENYHQQTHSHDSKAAKSPNGNNFLVLPVCHCQQLFLSLSHEYIFGLGRSK